MLLDHMEYVYAVYQERSFSKAAQKLFVSQPWLSSVVKKVEQQIQLPIFNRSTTPISLTEAGACYIETVERIMAMQTEMRQRLSELSAQSGTTLHIGSSMFFCTYVLPRILTEFREKYPQITLSFSEGDSAAMMRRLQEGQLDFLLESELPDSPALDSLVWATEQMVLAVPDTYAINEELTDYRYTFAEFLRSRKEGWAKPAVPLSLFQRENFLLLKRGNDSYKRGVAICKNAGFVPKVTSYLEQMMTAYYLVCEGRGIAFLRSTIPEYVTPTDRVVFYGLDDPMAQRELYLTFRKKGGSPVQQNLIDFMKEQTLTPERTL